MTEHLTDLLERDAAGAPAYDPAVLDAAMARGRTLRRRRTAGRLSLVAATGVVAVVAATATLTRGDNGVATPEPLAPTTQQTAEPAPVADRSGKQAMPEAFAAYGVVSNMWERVDGDLSTMTATITDPQGRVGGIAVLVSTTPPYGFPGADFENQPTECAQLDASWAPDYRCTKTADGVLLVTFTERTYTDERDDGEYANVAEALHPDGFVTNVRSVNSAGEKTGKTLEHPVLSLEQASAVVLDPIWRHVRMK